MKKKVLFILLVVVLAAGLILIGCTTPAEQEEEEEEEEEVITLSFAHFPPAHTFPCVSMEDWVQKVEERTEGKVIIETFPGGTLLTVPAMFDGVLAGVADIGCSCTSYEPGRFPLLAGMDIAMGFPSAKVASHVVWELHQEFQPASLADFKVLHMYTCAPNYICTIDPVQSLDDLEGMDIRAAGTVVPVLGALGAAVVDLPMSELPENLATGVVKGYSSSLEVLMDFEYAEIVHYAVDYPLVVVSFAVVMNKDVWDSLPADVQQVMDDLALEHSVWTGEVAMDAHIDESLQWAIDEHGFQMLTLSPEEKAKWDEALEPLVDGYLADTAAKGLPGQEFIDRLYELMELYSE